MCWKQETPEEIQGLELGLGFRVAMSCSELFKVGSQTNILNNK